MPDSNTTKTMRSDQVVGPVTCWFILEGYDPKEHLAGMNPDGDLVVFTRVSRQSWSVINISATTHYKISTPVSSWLMHGTGETVIENLAAVSTKQDLLVFSRFQQQGWKVTNVSEKTMQKIVSPVTCWQVPVGSSMIEYLAGVTAEGNLCIFWRTPDHDWQVMDVTQKTGMKISTPVVSWQAPDGQRVSENLAGSSPEGDLLVLKRSFQRDWHAVNASENTEEPGQTEKPPVFNLKLSDT